MCEVFERRFSLQIPLIVTQLNLTIDQLRIIRRKRKHAFLYHCLLLCDCSRTLIRAQEYISLVFPKRTKCAGSVQFGEKCAGSVFFSKKTHQERMKKSSKYQKEHLFASKIALTRFNNARLFSLFSLLSERENRERNVGERLYTQALCRCRCFFFFLSLSLSLRFLF